MAIDRRNQGIIVQGGSFVAHNVTVGEHASTTINGDPSSAADFLTLLRQFHQELESASASIPSEQRETMQTLATQMQTEVAKEKPNRSLAQITASGLKQAAESVRDVAPALLQIATEVAKWYCGM